jgi:hypothetical protein
MIPTKRKFDLSKVRTRYEPPTLEDAVFAAQGLTDDTNHQVQIAVELTGQPESEVRAAVLKARTPEIRVTTRAARRQPLIVERRNPRAVGAR